MTRHARAAAAILVAASTAYAQPAGPVGVSVSAEALRAEGKKRLHAGAFEQALANFLEAYARSPSPALLLEIAATLRDMGRTADAANTYQRYLDDAAAGAEHLTEVTQNLAALDAQLTILIVHGSPTGSEVSIDGGPFVTITTSLRARVRPGLHLVRIRTQDVVSEVTVNGFDGERKELGAAAASPSADHIDGWLITGTQYSADEVAGVERKVRAGSGGPEIRAVVPRMMEPAPTRVAVTVAPTEPIIRAGVIAALRIDGEGRGFAGGLGLAIAHGRFEGDLMLLKSDSTGGYLGVRYQLRAAGWALPYLALGMPAFAYDQTDETDMQMSTKLAIGVRGAAGVELAITTHVSVQADLGYEHFFVRASTHIDPTIFVPTLGVIGRL